MEGAAPESGTGTAAMPQVSYTDLEEKLARAQRERDEALEQQKATAEVLRVISASLQTHIADPRAILHRIAFVIYGSRRIL